jgi:hypothetical protein
MRAHFPLETRVFKAFGAVLAAGLVLVAGQVPASATDTPAPTRFSEFSITPTSVDVDHPTVTYTGRLVSTGDDGVEQGLANAPVCLTKDAPCIGYTTTDADGRFTASVTLSASGEHPMMVGGVAGAHYQGNRTSYYANVSPGIYLHVRPAKTRISMAFDPAPSIIGDPVDVTGLLERQTPDGGWAGAPGQMVRVFVSDKQVAQGLTAADGRYRIPTTVPGEGSWHVETPYTFERVPSNLGGEYGPCLGTRVDSGYLVAYHRTTITGFNASPEPVGKGSTITARGRVMRVKADGTTEPGTGSPMLEFSADGKKWTNVLGVDPDARGYFTITTPAVRDGYWRADTSQMPGYYELPSTSGADYVDVRYRTAISGFNASPEPIKKGRHLTVAGTLKRDTTSWTAFSGQSVKIYFAADGARTWTYEGTAKTSSTGHFSRVFTASKDGTWRATYAGSATYLAVTGSGDHVDVR